MDSQSTSVLFSLFGLPKYNFSFNYEHRNKIRRKFFCCFWYDGAKNSLLNNILLSCKQQKNCSFWQYPSVLFFTTPTLLYIYALFSYFFRKVSLVSIYSPLYNIYWHYMQRHLWWWAFFRDVHSKDEKAFHSQKKERIFFCPAQVPSFGSLISFSSTTNTTIYQCNAEEFLRVALATSECFESSLCILVFYVLKLFSCFNFFKTLLQLLLFHSRMSLFFLLTMHSYTKNVSHWIATLRRLGCNLRYSKFLYCLCSFLRFKSFCWEILHQIILNFFFLLSLTPSSIYFLIIFWRRRLQCLWAAAALVQCECCYTHQPALESEVIYYDMNSSLDGLLGWLKWCELGSKR